MAQAKKKTIKQFIQEVRTEMRRVTWPTTKETRLTTIFVFILAVIASIFFMVVDNIIYRLVQFIVG